MYRVVLTKSAEKHFSHIDVRYKNRVARALMELQTCPFMGKKLKGQLDGVYSFRVWPYRILYQVLKGELVVLVIHIGHRQGVYE